MRKRRRVAALQKDTAVNSCKLAADVLVRQAVKSIPQYPLVIESSRQRIHLGESWQIAVKSGVKTSDLRDFREVGPRKLYHANALRSVVGIDSGQFLEGLDHFVSNEMRLGEAATAVDDPVA